MILQAAHAHLYPGLSGKISGLEEIADLQTGCDCLVAFVDGSAATACISKFETHWLLGTRAYRTAAGTDIGAKLWRISLEEYDEHVAFRILAKAQGRKSETRCESS